MKISAVSYSVSSEPGTLEEWEKKFLGQLKTLLDEDARIVVYPELFLMTLSNYFPGEEAKQYKFISDYVQAVLLGKISKLVAKRDVLICLGSGPREEGGKIFNSSPIWVNETWMFQDKIHLTPWENDFTAGTQVNYFLFNGLRAAVVICFDIEQPGLGLTLKRSGVDLLLVPSATTNKNGSQRVNRCASARSIELGAAVITCPLIGTSKCGLIDYDEGRQGFFLPAQELVHVDQEVFSEYSNDKEVVNHYQLQVKMMKDLKKVDFETKPYLKEDLILP